jgi:hypothetical protein
MQLDIFGATDETAITDVAPPSLSAGAWRTADVVAFEDALRRGSLSGALGLLNRLKVDGAVRVLLGAGFTIGADRDRAKLMSGVQLEVIEAASRRMNGHELKAARTLYAKVPVPVPVAAAVADDEATVAVEESPEVALHAYWTETGVSQEKQDALIQQIGEKAESGAEVGPFTIGGKEEVKETSPVGHNTEDAGVELSYNRRNRVRAGLKWEDLSGKNVTLRVKETTKTNVYPRPDYEALIADGMQPVVAHLVKQVYDTIATKPMVRGVPSDEDLQRYIDGVNRVMSGAMTWARDNQSLSKWAAGQARSAGAMLGRRVSLSELSEGSRTLLDTVYPGGWKEFRSEVTIVGSNKLLGALQPDYDEARRAFKAIEAGWPSKQEAWQKQGYHVVETEAAVVIHTGSSYRAGERVEVAYFRIKGHNSESFDSVVEAAKAKEAFAPWLFIDKYGRVKGQFGTETEALEGAREFSKRKTKTSTVDDSGIDAAEATRAGIEYRLDGEDISTDTLKETFGFTGVNFGNWMKGDSNVAERQMHLNHAYDSFMDLAALMDVPPKAMSLNGILGIAFGAQGNGRFAAHFVPGVNQINLTRHSGAGSLAHEWGHALDHYFATQAGLEATTEPYLTEHAELGGSITRMVWKDGKYQNETRPRFNDIRPEILEVFKAITQAMNKRDASPEEIQQRTQLSKDKTIRSVGQWLDQIKKDFKAHEPVFAVLADKIRKLDVGLGHVTIGRQTYVYPAVAEIRDAYKKATGKTYPVENLKGLQSNLSFLVHLNSEEYAQRNHEPQRVSTEYSLNAAKLDRDKGGKPYWSTNVEKFARAFDAFVSDKLAEKAARNSYLSHTGREGDTVPLGQDRIAINAAFRSLVSAIKTRDTDVGVALYSRGNVGPTRGPMERDVADARIRGLLGERLGAVLLDSGLLSLVDAHSDLPSGAEFHSSDKSVKGATYSDGRVALVLENLSEADFAGVAQHEFFHSAAKTWLGNDAYEALMKRLSVLREKAESNISLGGDGLSDWFAKARMAIPGDTPEEHVLEEMAGYAIEQFVNGEKQPSGIRGWVNELLSSLRVAVIKHMPEGVIRNWALENLEPRDLAKAAVTAMKAIVISSREVETISAGTNSVQFTSRSYVPSLGELQDAYQQFQSTAARVGGEDAFHKALEAGSTKLNYEQWVQVRTPAFKEWFGDWEGDTAVDSNTREPIVFYHGTSAEFSTFDPRSIESENGFFFSTSFDHASEYVKDSGSERVMPVFLRSTNPYVVTSEQWNFGQGLSTEEAKVNGFDGYIIKGQLGGDTHIVFSPNQIKSAVHNVGLFSERPDIRYSKEAEQISHHSDVPTLVANVKLARGGLHIGRVVDIRDGLVVQDAGRGSLVSHDMKALDRVPKLDDLVKIGYSAGKGTVQVAAREGGRAAER